MNYVFKEVQINSQYKASFSNSISWNALIRSIVSLKLKYVTTSIKCACFYCQTKFDLISRGMARMPLKWRAVSTRCKSGAGRHFRSFCWLRLSFSYRTYLSISMNILNFTMQAFSSFIRANRTHRVTLTEWFKVSEFYELRSDQILATRLHSFWHSLVSWWPVELSDYECGFPTQHFKS